MPAFAIVNNLDWTVSHRQLFFADNNGEMQPANDKVAVVRDDNGTFLGSVSTGYETVQNRDLLNLIQPLVEEGLLEIKNIGYLNQGARVFAQAQICEEYQIIGETYRGFITLLNGHTGNHSLAIGSSNVRVVCGNTFAMAYNQIGEKFRHQNGVNERILESDAVRNYVDSAMRVYAENVEALATTRCTGSQFLEAIEKIYQRPTTEMRDSFVSKLNELFYNGQGNDGSSFYSAFNAITDYNSNESRKTFEGRFNYANFGKGASVGQRAMAVLTEMAAV